MYVPFSITASSSAQRLTIIAELDATNPGSATFAEHVGYAIEFDVGAADIYVGTDASVVATGNSYNQSDSSGNITTTGHRGRKYAAGTHVEMTLNKDDVLWVVTGSSTSVCEGSVLGV